MPYKDKQNTYLAVKRYRERQKSKNKDIQDNNKDIHRDIQKDNVIPVNNDLKLYQNDDFKELYNRVEELESTLSRLVEVLKHNGMRGF